MSQQPAITNPFFGCSRQQLRALRGAALSLGRELLLVCLWRLPLAVARCTACCLVIAAVAGLLLEDRLLTLNFTAQSLCASCYLLAGVVWGIQATVRATAELAATRLEHFIAHRLDDWLVDRGVQPAPMDGQQDCSVQGLQQQVRESLQKHAEQMLNTAMRQTDFSAALLVFVLLTLPVATVIWLA